MAKRVRAERWRALLVSTLHRSPFAAERHPEEEPVERKGEEQVQNVSSHASAKQCEGAGCLADTLRPLLPCPPHQPPPTTTTTPPAVCACVSWELQGGRVRQREQQLQPQRVEEDGRPRRARQTPRQLMLQATCACVRLSLTMHPAIVPEQGLPTELPGAVAEWRVLRR